MSKVFVVDTNKQPLEPVHPGRARLLLKEGKAAVYRRFPFTLILKRTVEEATPAPLRLKIDPGANTTGLALVNDASGEVMFAAELTHQGGQIKKMLRTRREVRRGRRARQGTYVGRVAVKANGYFTIQTKAGKIPDVAHRFCTVIQRTDGYRYCFGTRLSPSSTSLKGAPVSSPA